MQCGNCRACMVMPGVRQREQQVVAGSDEPCPGLSRPIFSLPTFPMNTCTCKAGQTQTAPRCTQARTSLNKFVTWVSIPWNFFRSQSCRAWRLSIHRFAESMATGVACSAVNMK